VLAFGVFDYVVTTITRQHCPFFSSRSLQFHTGEFLQFSTGDDNKTAIQWGIEATLQKNID